ncbi:D-alanine--D-alanine ligase [Aliikangiella sp. G2MR2-5]|uniref:D-alanine--D-alanine ligase n=1 Tax=Aliikangiella sp. G2MR2-5 TaxID=2788943 RepID=UPI0018AB8EE5|nr:D-alanine--D-alanine ligase [Aliikangiella sp. G2MR2-5]
MNFEISRKPQEYGKVAVLLGGNSAERDISLMSGEAIFSALIKSGVDAVKVDPKDGLINQLIDKSIERVFIALHGREGEDGVVQGCLQSMGIPYTGSNVVSAAMSMDKLISKRLWKQMGIPTAHFSSVEKGQKFTEIEARRLFAKLGPVLFVKPVKEGSSVGMSKVSDEKSLVEGVRLAHQYDNQALVETFTSGKEYTVSILRGKALPSISMETPRDFYDYEAKYQSNQTKYFCPSGLSDDDETVLQRLALKAFGALGCSGWGRVDFIRDGEFGEFLILEANTVPGMTMTSLVPKAAKAVGLGFEQLVLNILETSFDVR